MVPMETYESRYRVELVKFANAWRDGRNAANTARMSLNAMVKILLEEDKNMTVRKALNRIAADSDGLEGFSVRNLYRELDDENRLMLQEKTKSVPKDDKPKIPKNVVEQRSTPPRQREPETDEMLEDEDDVVTLKTENEELKEALKSATMFANAATIPKSAAVEITIPETQFGELVIALRGSKAVILRSTSGEKVQIQAVKKEVFTK